MACEDLSGKRIGRHKYVVEKTVTYCSRAGVVVATEALIPGGRMDITLHNLDKFPSYADVSITHPCLKSYLDGAAVKAGSAASAREKVKRDKYIPHIAKNIGFFPLVMETYGFMGKEFRSFIQKVESDFKPN